MKHSTGGSLTVDPSHPAATKFIAAGTAGATTQFGPAQSPAHQSERHQTQGRKHQDPFDRMPDFSMLLPIRFGTVDDPAR